MKKLFSALLCLRLLMLGCAQAEWLPLYEAYPVDLDGNAWIEVPNEYDVWDVTIDYPCLYIVSESMQMALAVKIPEGYRHKWTSQSADVSGFQEDGVKVLGGMEATDASTVIERYAIGDLPAARVDMTGQGYEMIWLGDGGDLYFFMYPLADAEFAADMASIASTLHLVESNTAPACQAADYEFVSGEEGVTITCYIGESQRVEVPAEIDGQPVVALGDQAFYDSSVTWLSIPDSVTRIGDYCFSGCTQLQTLRLPEGLKEIPAGMLESCFRLLALEIPDTVTTIGESAFWCNMYLEELRLPASLENLATFNFVGMDCLERFIVAEDNACVKTLDGGAVLLSADGSRFIHYCNWQERTSYTIPEGVTFIDSFAFEDWGTLNEIVVPEGVTTIRGAAFIRAFNLQRLTLPQSAADLGGITVDAADEITGDGGLVVTAMGAADQRSAVNLGKTQEGASAITGSAVIIAPEGSAAQAHAEQFNLAFEAVTAADEILDETITE